VNRIVAASRYLALAGVFFGLIASLTAFAWGGVKTVLLVVKLAHGEMPGMAVGLVQVMDAFLIASGLLIFALGLYELFIGEIDLPAWLLIPDLDALKSKLAGVIIMVMAVAFLERLETQAEAHDILASGVAVALVSVALIALGWKRKA
jgi:uncharacterized membrane protein YqhA